MGSKVTDDVREGVDALLAKRARLQQEIEDIDGILDGILAGLRRHVWTEKTPVITEIPPAPAPARRVIRRIGRGPSSGLRGAIASVLVTGPATSGQIRDRLKANGVSTDAKNLQAIVNNTMKRNPQQFVRTDLGAWSLVDQSAVDLL